MLVLILGWYRPVKNGGESFSPMLRALKRATLPRR
jgi:hypothetical protein